MCHESRCSQMLVLVWVPMCVCVCVVRRSSLDYLWKRLNFLMSCFYELLMRTHHRPHAPQSHLSPPPTPPKQQLPLFYPRLIHFNINSNSIYSSWTCVSDSGTVCHFHVLMSPISFFHPQNVFFYLLIYLLCNFFIVFHYTGLKFPILLSKINFILYIFYLHKILSLIQMYLELCTVLSCGTCKQTNKHDNT